MKDLGLEYGNTRGVESASTTHPVRDLHFAHVSTIRPRTHDTHEIRSWLYDFALTDATSCVWGGGGRAHTGPS